MKYVFTKKFDGTFTMSWVGEPVSTDEVSTQIRDIKTFQIIPTKSITSITNFSDVVRGETDEHYFKRMFSYSNEKTGVTHTGITYTDEMPITGITREYCPENLLYMNLYYFRIDNKIVTPTTTLSINSIVIEGTYDLELTDEIIDIPDQGYILEPKNIYKVFKLSGFEIYGVNTNNLVIKYRFTQDGGRSYTTWEELTAENISTKKLNPVRFAQVQYHISKIDNAISSKVYDIILLGDFQNINNYYLKTNRYGVREDCAEKFTQWSRSTNADDPNGGSNICLSGLTRYDAGNPYNYNRDFFTAGLSCYLTGNVIGALEAENNTDVAVSGNYDPYSQGEKISDWYNFLANGTNKILGWPIDYHLTDPDGNGIDRYLHEYQLFNIVDVQKIKIIVPENEFPDNQVQINEFMLDMMDTFQIIILKDEFHKAFGIEKRPAQKDIIFFCQANRFYRVKHAQVKRDIMYMGHYYNVVLEKYEKLANEQNLSEASNNLIEPLTRNNTIDELFGFENKEEENKIISEQFKPTTHEVYRVDINNSLEILNKNIYNGLKGTKIADNYYNLSSLPVNTSAVTYTKTDNILKVSDNRAFNLWFNFNNKYNPDKIITEEVYQSYYINDATNYEFFNNFDSTKEKGYKLSYYNKQLILNINEFNYNLDVSGMSTNIWYGLTVNVDNRQRKISIDLFKRNYSYNIKMFTPNYQSVTINSENQTGITYYTSNGYRPVKNTEINATLEDTNLVNLGSIEFEGVPLNSFEINKTITLMSSDIKLTNLRILTDVIPDESKSNLLIQRIIQDADKLLLADNASRELYTANVKNTRWE